MGKQPLTKTGWYIFIAIAAVIDGLQLLIDLIPGIGEALNAILDIIIGIVIAFIYWRKQAINTSTFIGLLVTFGAEEATLTLGPFWWADVTYTMIKSSAAQKPGIAGVVGRLATDSMKPGSSSGPLNQGGVRPPRNADLQPLNQSGIRQPRNDMPLKSISDTNETLAA